MAPALLKKSSLVSLRKGRFSFRLLGQMTYNGSSEGLSELSAGITVFLFNWVMMKNWGEVGVAAFTAINYMLNLGVQMFVGLSDGIVPILSFNYGAGHLNRVKETLFLGFKTNATIGIIRIMIYPVILGDNGVWLTVPLAEFFTFVSTLYLLRKRLKKWSVSIHA